MKKSVQSQSGFTILELVVVILAALILVAIIFFYSTR